MQVAYSDKNLFSKKFTFIIKNVDLSIGLAPK